MLTQKSMIKEYTDNFVPKFNEKLFIRSTDLIIDELKKVILSCQREYGFILRVESFTVIDDYEQVQGVLYNQDEEYNRYKRSKKNVNPYDYIQTKETDVVLLIVRYYIQVKDKYEYVNVIIAVPRVVNKYYYRINGKLCYATYQISDTTYNNSTSANMKFPRVTLRTIFMPIKIFRKKFKMNTIFKEELYVSFYISKIFSKMFGVCKYFLGKYGLYDCISFMGYNDAMFIADRLIENVNDYYVFEKHNIFIYVLKPLFVQDETLQSFVYTIYQSIHKDTDYSTFFSVDYWLRNLGKEFNIDSVEKGMEVLVSLEGLYDIKTKEIIKLPYEEKKDIYHLLRWMCREYGPLMVKSNTNVAVKRVRRPEEYIASMYAAKISTGLYRVANSNKKGRISIKSIKKVVCTLPMFLISAISKCNLVNYRDLVNDLDSMVILNYNFKGIAGVGDDMNSIPEVMRRVDLSHLGRFDLDSSKKSSPGLAASLLPTCYIDNDGYMSDFQEPMTWEGRTNEVMRTAKDAVGLQEAITFEEQILGKTISEEEKQIANENVSIMKNLIQPIYFIYTSDDISKVGFAAEESGSIVLSEDDEMDGDIDG